MINIIVFLGPTLKLEDAKAILPDAVYLPPVQAGDILHCIRLKPKIIAIIDGFFEHTRSIWHKEILFALEYGVEVYGASSMGALRARELQSFGMQGIGEIFENYNNTLNEDDAVAILHGPASSNYLPQSESFVNIRATIKSALSQHMIDDITASILENAAKSLFYPERNLKNIIDLASQENANTFFLENFSTWVKENGFRNVKKEDALKLLTYIAKNPDPSSRKIFKLERPLFFRTHHKSVQCAPFPYDVAELPIQEKVAVHVSKRGMIFRSVKRLAYLLSAVYTLAATAILSFPRKRESIQMDSRFRGNDKIDLDIQFTLPAHFGTDMWRKQNDCNKEMEEAFYCRFQKIKNFTTGSSHDTDYLLALMRLSRSKDYSIYRSQISSKEDIIKAFQEKEPLKYRIYSLTASLWQCIDQHAESLHLEPHMESIQKYSSQFRAQQKLYSIEETEKWLKANDLSKKDFTHLMRLATRLNYLVLQNNLDVFGVIDTEEKVWWFLDALYLSGVYGEIRIL